jgi:hypothetical protein
VSAIWVDDRGDVSMIVDSNFMYPDISIDKLKDKLRPYINLEAF